MTVKATNELTLKLALEYIALLKEQVKSLKRPVLVDPVTVSKPIEEGISHPPNTVAVVSSENMVIVEDSGCYVCMSYIGDNNWRPSPWLTMEVVDRLKELPRLKDEEY
jgi:hypothetical protein